MSWWCVRHKVMECVRSSLSLSLITQTGLPAPWSPAPIHKAQSSRQGPYTGPQEGTHTHKHTHISKLDGLLMLTWKRGVMHGVRHSAPPRMKKCLSKNTGGYGYVTFLHIFSSHHWILSPETDKRIKYVKEVGISVCSCLCHKATFFPAGASIVRVNL